MSKSISIKAANPQWHCLDKGLLQLITWAARIGGLMLLMVGLFVLYEVVCRYVFQSPTLWVMDYSIIFPILLAIGIDPVWFAVIMTINMEFALITPPVGLNLFVIKGVVEDASLMEVFQGTLPFMLLMLAVLVLVLVIIFPQLSLWLPFMVR